MHADQDAFVVVDGHPHRTLELFEDELQATRRSNVSTQNQQRVVSVLQHGARGTINQGVQEDIIAANQPLKNVGDDEEEVG
jgi:hypothetical protein